MAKSLSQRVADEARPPAVLGRYPGMRDYYTEVLLDDLVESGGEDPIIGRTQKNVRKFAAMDPVVDLESLRGMKVKVFYDD